MKKNVLWIVLDLVFLIVFNITFFVVGGTDHPSSVWISYGFIHFSYLMLLLSPLFVKESNSLAVYGFSISSISTAYFLIEFVVGLVFIFLKQEKITAALIVQLIIAGAYVITLVSHLIANEKTAEEVEKHEKEVAYIKQCSSRVKKLIGKSGNRKVNREIENLYDLLHSSPSKTAPSVHTIERTIFNEIVRLEEIVSDEYSELIVRKIRDITFMIDERNRQLQIIQ